MMALSQLLSRDASAAPVDSNPLAAKPGHFPARAKNVIFLFMEGGPSQLDLFDPKPDLAKLDGSPLPESMRKGLRFAFIKPTAKVWASRRSFVSMATPECRSPTGFPSCILRGRFVHGSVDVQRSVQSSSRSASATLRQSAGGQALHGIVAALRSWQ